MNKSNRANVTMYEDTKMNADSSDTLCSQLAKSFF